MSYKNDVTINGFELGIGRIICFEDFKKTPMQIIVNLDNEKIISAIKNLDIEILKAFQKAYEVSDEVDAINTFHNFEHYFTQGYSWSKAAQHYSFSTLEDYKRKATIVMNSKLSNDLVRHEAKQFLDFLDGKEPVYIPSESDLISRKEEKFRKSRSKWLKLLIERDGYQCKKCKIDKDLCVKHTISIRKGGETELSNLSLSCRKCINKK
jgi:hypothetical protein